MDMYVHSAGQSEGDSNHLGLLWFNCILRKKWCVSRVGDLIATGLQWNKLSSQLHSQCLHHPCTVKYLKSCLLSEIWVCVRSFNYGTWLWVFVGSFHYGTWLCVFVGSVNYGTCQWIYVGSVNYGAWLWVYVGSVNYGTMQWVSMVSQISDQDMSVSVIIHLLDQTMSSCGQ